MPSTQQAQIHTLAAVELLALIIDRAVNSPAARNEVEHAETVQRQNDQLREARDRIADARAALE